MNINITEKAATFIRSMIRFNGAGEDYGFRLVVSLGGCSGFNSSFTVEASPQQDDTVLNSNGVKVFLPTDSCTLLEGVTVDFADTAMSTGLRFINPNAPSCACSTAGAPPPNATINIASIQRRH